MQSNLTNDDNLPARSPAAEAERRRQLEQRVRELGGIVGPAGAPGESAEDDALVNRFLERALAWETAPQISHRTWLERNGWTFAPPGTLRGEALAAELWRLIQALAVARVFLEHTDHLTDEELYWRLWNDVLEERSPDLPRLPEEASHWDLAAAGTVGEEDWLTYYADEDERAEWAEGLPPSELPAHRDPPNRRDWRLPVPER